MKGVDVIPAKLRDDAIVEAVCQVNFSVAGELGEVVLGRLSDYGARGDFTSSRLPLADLPAAVRQGMPQFVYQPLLELRSKGNRLMRVGDNVLSWHVIGVGSYPGWMEFRRELQEVVSHLFSKVPTVEILNISLRYINALGSTRHRVSGVHDLKLAVGIAGEPFRGRMNLNFSEPDGQAHVVTTRIADVSFVNGTLPSGTVAIVDVEVSADANYRTKAQGEVHAWLEAAHTLEKRAFFRLIPADIVQQLAEE